MKTEWMRMIFALLALVLAGCQDGADRYAGEETRESPSNGATVGVAADPYERHRFEMVKWQIEDRGVKDPKVLEAMRKVPRHEFVPEAQRRFAYGDGPLPIGHDQTISQPYIVALMTELLKLNEDSKVLEIGTGSGYQAAILGELANEVYTIEIVEPLGLRAKQTLSDLEYENVHVRIGDGYRGWPEAAPFDAIIVTAAPENVPKPLVEQLKTGGRMVIPVGSNFMNQELYVMIKNADGTLKKESVLPVRFVPMTGEAERN